MKKKTKKRIISRTVSSAINRYRNVNLNVSDIHFQFANKLIVELNEDFKAQTIGLIVEKNNSLEVNTDEIRIITPSITALEIVVEDIMTIKLHALMEGICIFDLNVKEICRSQGIGRKVLSTMCDISENLNLPIYLIPVDYEGCIGIENLRNFYHSCHFKRKPDSYYWMYNPDKHRIAC